MALSQPRSNNRASKHMRVGSVTPGLRTASVTAGMEPRNVEVLRKVHEQAKAEEADRKPAPKGVLRNLRPIASSVASVGPRMVKFRSNIQYLGEKVSSRCCSSDHDACIKPVLLSLPVLLSTAGSYARNLLVFT